MQHTRVDSCCCCELLPLLSGQAKVLRHYNHDLDVCLQGYQVLLDRTIVKTPARHELLLPTKPLALAIAAEWAWQVRRDNGLARPLTPRLSIPDIHTACKRM